MNEHVRQYAKEIQKLLLNVVMHDNEENAMLALKILADHLRGLRLQFTPEVGLKKVFLTVCKLRS